MVTDQVPKGMWARTGNEWRVILTGTEMAEVRLSIVGMDGQGHLLKMRAARLFRSSMTIHWTLPRLGVLSLIQTQVELWGSGVESRNWRQSFGRSLLQLACNTAILS
ncbi:hypothetical protein GWK47_039178 [Chionoecetes opilio]|uniref:Uncharacterized protein n=1 Tax=Chionoecetes opilio TaxID=41210 RepID=A0A8J4YR76_CHIOP|nr:hypothetical protein GWK47_039178 [Chionoecetes opilio]